MAGDWIWISRTHNSGLLVGCVVLCLSRAHQAIPGLLPSLRFLLHLPLPLGTYWMPGLIRISKFPRQNMAGRTKRNRRRLGRGECGKGAEELQQVGGGALCRDLKEASDLLRWKSREKGVLG